LHSGSGKGRSEKIALDQLSSSSSRLGEVLRQGCQTKGMRIPGKSSRVEVQERPRQALLETEQGGIAQTNNSRDKSRVGLAPPSELML
jgi:hypothetical protein